MLTVKEAREFAAKKLGAEKLPYVGRLPDGSHVLALNNARAVVGKRNGTVELTVVRQPRPVRLAPGRRV